jgi:monofunctional glycosyltransferase
MLRTGWRIAWKTGLVVIALIVVYQIWLLCNVLYLINHNPRSSAFMENRLETLQDKNAKAQLQHRWVPYSRISNHLKRAMVAAEDAKFIEHEGFDWEGMHKAYEKNIKKGKIVAGGSTISQQLAKNLFLSGSRNPLRKVQEAVITVMIEQLMSKQRIFEIYLNIIEWGNGVFGAEAAAQHYFNVSASNITATQAAQLAAIVPNPRFYDAHRNSRWIARRVELLSYRMHSAQIP